MTLLLIVLGCTSQESYTADLAEARCATYERCDVLQVLGFDGVDQCIELDAGADDDAECEDFDRAAAADCVKGWERISCEGMADEQPQACFETCLDAPADTAEE